MGREDKTCEKYLEWQANHSCLINHTGSSSSMESCGALNIFHRSVERYNFRYEYYLGDSDSSSFQSVEDAKPFHHKKVGNVLDTSKKVLEVDFEN